MTKYISIIAPASSNPVTYEHTNNPNWNFLDQNVELKHIQGKFEVREVDTTPNLVTYSLMFMN